MSKDRSTLSYAHNERNHLPKPDRLYDRAGSATKSFEQNRCPYPASQLRDDGKSESQRRSGGLKGKDDFDRAARRESFMIKRQKPQPVLKPSLALSLGPDRAAFNKQWMDERIAASKKKRSRSR